MKEIKAQQGYYLTQVAEVGEDRIYITALKGVNMDESQWREASVSEKEEWEKTLSKEYGTIN